MPEQHSTDRLEQARSRLSENYRQSLEAKIEALHGLADPLHAGDVDSRDAVRRIAHQLRGSGASFGFPRITEAAGRVEDAPEDRMQDALCELIGVLREIKGAAALDDSTFILIVEDDAQLVSLLQNVLKAPGRQFRCASTLAEARKHLENVPLDLVILDLNLPDGDGRNLLASLQDRPQTAEVPVVVLSSTKASRTQTECLNLGAEQYFEKPAQLELIAAGISGILNRRRRHAAEVRVDTLTGLSNRAGFREAFERAAKLRDRADLPLSLAILDLDHFKSVNDTYGHGFGDEVLRLMGRLLSETFRQTDLSARWGGEEFVVLFQQSRPRAARVALRKLQDRLRKEGMATESGDTPVFTFSAGVVDVSSDETLDAALARADRLLYFAKSAGRDRVFDSVPAEAKNLAARVMVVEDDEDAAALVGHSLVEGGFEVSHYRDGLSALSAAEDIRHDLAILDKQMPELDGFEVLRQLRSKDGYQTIPIIMLTAVGREDEIERAFELGADDYVQKPFRSRELMARVRRLIRR